MNAILAVLVGAAAVGGCGSPSTASPSPGSIALAVNPAAASIPVGGHADAIVTLTRNDGFTGAVTLTVSGLPTAVTAAVSGAQSGGGTVSTVTITLTVASGASPGVYPLVIHGTGAGITEATGGYSLTVP